MTKKDEKPIEKPKGGEGDGQSPALKKALDAIRSMTKGKLSRQRFIDDKFFRVSIGNDKKAMGHILSVILEKEVEVESIKTAKTFSNQPGFHSVIFDALVIDGEGSLIDVEVQTKITKNLYKRGPFYLSFLTQRSLLEKQDYKLVKSHYVVFILSRDLFKENLPVYRYYLRRGKSGDGPVLTESLCVVYFNCAYRGEDEFGRLANDMMARSEGDIFDISLRQCMHYNKSKRRSDKTMGKETEELYYSAKQEGREEGREQGKMEREAEIVRALFVSGLSAEEISQRTKIPLEAVCAMLKLK